MSNRWVHRAVTGVVALGLVGAGCSTSDVGDATSSTASAVDGTDGVEAMDPGPTTGLTDSTVKIAVMVPDFGPLEGTGLVPELGDVEAQVRATVDHLNDNGGIAGRTIEASFHTFDPADSSGTSARAACIEATEEEQAFAVVGLPSWSAIGTLCVAAEHETPIVTTTAVTPSLIERSGGRVFSTTMDLARMFGAWATVLDDRGALDGKTVGIVLGDGDETMVEAIEGGLEPALADLGIEVAEKVTLPCTSTTCEQHENAVEKLRAADVDFVFDVLGPLSSPTFIAAAHAAGYEPELTFSSTLINDTVAGFHESVAPKLDGMIGVADYGPPNPGEAAENSQFALDCVDRYTAAAGLDDISDDEAGMTSQGCLLLEIIRQGAANVDELGQTSLVRGIESLGSLTFDDPAPSACTTSAPPLSFGPDKHGGGNWVMATVFDGDTSQFLREDPCVYVTVDD